MADHEPTNPAFFCIWCGCGRVLGPGEGRLQCMECKRWFSCTMYQNALKHGRALLDALAAPVVRTLGQALTMAERDWAALDATQRYGVLREEAAQRVRALWHAVNALHNDEEKDLKPSLWSIVRELDPVVARLLENDRKRAFEHVTLMLEMLK